MKSVDKSKLLLVIVDILILILILPININSTSFEVLSWISLTISIYCVVSLMSRDRWQITPIILFIGMFSICMYGQLIIKYIVQFENSKLIIDSLPKDRLFEAIKISLYCNIAMHIGTSIPNRKQLKVKINNKRNEIIIKSLKLTGLILLIISLLPAIYIFVTKLQSMNLYGYKGVFDAKQVGLGSIVEKLSTYFTLAIFILCISYKDVRILIIGSLYIGSQVMFGARGIPILTVVCLLMGYHYGVKKFDKKTIVLLIVGSFLVVNVLAMIAVLRRYPLSTWASNLDGVILHLNESNPLYELIIEIGTAIAPTTYALLLVPNTIPIKFGITYLCAMILMVPDIIGFRTLNTIQNAQIDQLVASYAGMPFGGSLVEEAYINFVFYAPLVFLMLGYIIQKFSLKYTISKSPVFMAYASYMMVYMLWLPRNVSNDFFQKFMYYVVFPWMLYKVIEAINLSRNKFKTGVNR